MSRLFAIGGAALFAGSLVFFVVSYAWRFGGAGVWSWNASGPPALVDVALFTAFALHHSIFARFRIRAWIERVSPPGMERSIYVWIASLLFLAVCGRWQPVPGVLWQLDGFWAALAIAAQLAGVALTLAAVRQLDGLALAGLKPSGSAPPAAVIDTGGYGLVRHPIYLGWFLMVWPAPTMNGTRLVFAATSCLYLLIAIEFEERDLRRILGDRYESYARRVRRKIVPGLY